MARSKKEVGSVTIEHDDLVAAAEELNELMFKEGEGIDVEASDKKITTGILEAAKQLTPDDKLSKGVKATLIAMNAIEEEEPEEPEVPEEEEEPEETPVTKKKAGKPAKEVEKAVPTKEVKKAKAVEEKEKPAKVTKVKKEKGPSFPRPLAVAMAFANNVGETVTENKLIQEADKLYTSKTGNGTNIKSTKRSFDRIFAALKCYNFVTVSGKDITISEALTKKMKKQG
jgi:outer membrane biosynthesis protein TonB